MNLVLIGIGLGLLVGVFALGYRVGSGQWLPSVSVDL